MSLIVSDGLSQYNLDQTTQPTGNKLDSATVHLFNSNITPDDSTTLATLAAAEATFPGYTAVTITKAHWPAAAVTSHIAKSQYDTSLDFTCTGGGASETIYGFWVQDSGGTILLLADTLSTGPQTMVNNLDKISITLQLTSQSKN